jgi:hypothetical protein
MNFEQSYRLWARQVPIAALRERVLALTDEDWMESTDPYEQTQTLPLLFDDDYRHDGPSRRALYETLGEVVEPVHRFVLAQFPPGSRIVRSMLVRLCVGGSIPQHVDRGFSMPYVHRLHLPLLSRPGVTFTIGGEPLGLREGELWEINNMRHHGVENTSGHERVHLIVDVSTPELEEIRTRDLVRFHEPLTIIANLATWEMMQARLSGELLIERLESLIGELTQWQEQHSLRSSYAPAEPEPLAGSRVGRSG